MNTESSQYGQLTAERLRHILAYNPDTGLLTYKRHPWKGRVGTPVPMRADKDGYMLASIERNSVRVHRICWCIHYGAMPVNQIDHINGDPADNRICNLREATNQQNSHNKHKPSKNSKSGFIGVHWDNERNKWAAKIGIDGKNVPLGRFNSLHDAIEARAKAKRDLHPFGAVLSEKHERNSRS